MRTMRHTFTDTAAFWAAFPDESQAWLPITLVDSGNQWRIGWGEDAAADAQQMVDHALARARPRPRWLPTGGGTAPVCASSCALRT